MIRRLWSHRYLVLSLVRREYQIRYRQSMGGLLWAVVPALIMVATATLVFHRVARVQTGGISYPIFAFSALAPWTFFSSSLTNGVTGVTRAAQMVTRLAFPRAALPLAMVGTAMIDLVIASGTFIAFTYATGHPLPITALWYPPLLIIEIVLATGVVFFVSALNVFARDMKVLVPFVAQLWLFLTPVFYPLASVPESLRGWFLVNPMTGLTESFRRVLVFGQGPDPGLLLPTVVGAMVALVVGIWYFAATETRFADVI